MGLQRIAIFALAAVAAIVAAFAVRGMISGGAPAEAAPPPPQLETAEVLVTTRAIEPGRMIQSSDLAWVAWPQSSAASLVTKAAEPSALDTFAGTVARGGLLAGEPVTHTKVVRASAEASLMSARLRPGHRAISIEISAETGAGGFILPDDRVDVILTMKPSANDGGNEQRPISETILTDVRVLAVDQTPSVDASNQTVVGKTATLELTPAQAERIAFARASGTIQLSLRGLADARASGEAAAGEEPLPPSVATVTFFRHGQRRAIAVSTPQEPPAEPEAPATGELR